MNLFLVQNALVSYHFGIYEKPFRYTGSNRQTQKWNDKPTNHPSHSTFLNTVQNTLVQLVRRAYRTEQTGKIQDTASRPLVPGATFTFIWEVDFDL